MGLAGGTWRAQGLGMKSVQQTLCVLGLMVLSAGAALAQSTVEKAKATGNDVKREVKKDAHRVAEALCTGSKAECAEQKLKHRGTEFKDTVVDKTKATKDTVDSDNH
jgi:hypothetical protein